MTITFADKPEFYPTPTHLAQKMVGKLTNRPRTILEPSAGKGDLAKVIHEKFARHYSTPSLDCIEVDPELQSLLKGKGYNVIHDDFLSYNGRVMYDAIVMNPPFSNAVDHVLQAWNVLYDGEIVALVNADTVRNPYDRKRELLRKIIADHNGSVEYVPDAFLDAERKTAVEVAIIHLVKVGDVKHDFFHGMTDGGNTPEVEEARHNQLAVAGRSIENTVLAYEKALEYGLKAIVQQREADYYCSLLKGSGASSKEMTADVKGKINDFVKKLKSDAWEHVVYSTDFSQVTTAAVRSKIMNDLEDLKRIEFTVKNIRTFLQNLYGNQTKIVADCLEEVFDMLTKYHKENRVHIEGWKSNDYFFVAKKVVLPHVFDDRWSGGLEISWNAQEKMMDIDRALSHLAGTRMPEVTIVDAVKQARENTGILGEKILSTYFEIRGFKKGTIHLRFRDLDLLNQLNLIVGRKRGWLPKGDAEVPQRFWELNA